MVVSFPFKVKALVSWAGEEDGDLGFLENEIIEVFSEVDDSWWHGRLKRNGMEGIFPQEYVKVVDDPPLSPTSSAPATPKKQQVVQQPGLMRSSLPYIKQGYKVSPKYFSASASASPKKFVSTDAVDETGTNDKVYKNGNFFSSMQDLERLRSPSKVNYSVENVQPFASQNDTEIRRNQKQNEIEKLKKFRQQQEYRVKPGRDKSNESDARLSHDTNASPLTTPKNKKIIYTPKELPSASPLYATKNHSPSFDVTKGTSLTRQSRALANPQLGFHERESSGSSHLNKIQNELDEIIYKRRLVEYELRRLKEVEIITREKYLSEFAKESHHKKTKDIQDFDYDVAHYTDETLSSKKNTSKEDLSNKLSRLNTEDFYERGCERLDSSDEEESWGSPPPPPPPKHFSSPELTDDRRNENLYRQSRVGPVPYDSNDFKNDGKVVLDEKDLMALSQMNQEELRNSIKSLQSDVLNLSELSATSAGSFLRHKQLKDIRGSQQDGSEERKTQGSVDLTEQRNKQLVESVFQNRKGGQPNFFKKFLGRRRDEIGLNPIEEKLQNENEVDWTTFKMGLNRLNSLSSHDRQMRTRRVVREEGSIVVKPLEYLSDLNVNETDGEDIEDNYDLKERFTGQVASLVFQYGIDSDLNEMLFDIDVKFNSSRQDQAKFILLHMCKFDIIREPGVISQSKPKLSDLLNKGEASIFQINYVMKKLFDALDIPAELIFGFWRKPDDIYTKDYFLVNHCWLSVLIENRYRIVDILAFQNGGMFNIRDHPRSYNEFYFLAEPIQVLSTHIPTVIEHQHVVPPVDLSIAYYMPRIYSGYYKNRLAYKSFNNALTRLKDFEIFEFEIYLPHGIELFTVIKTENMISHEYCLCQCYMTNEKRVAKIKAILPENIDSGILQVFAGQKGKQRYFENVHEIAMTIPLYHSGQSRSCQFVTRFPTVQSQNNDLYIKKPLTNTIVAKELYNFEVQRFPSQDPTEISGLLNDNFKMVIESPSGKYYKLTQSDCSSSFGAYEGSIKCQETGLYRGLVIGDNGSSWNVFAQWNCIPTAVKN